MAKTKKELEQLSEDTFFDNEEGLIEPEAHRNFNKELLDSMATEAFVQEKIEALELENNTFIACRRWYKD